MRWRLSLLMFLVYAPPGAVLPLLPLHLRQLGFTPLEIGSVCAASSLGSLAAPLVAGQVADRWLAAERCLTLYAFAGAGLLWLLAHLSSFPAVFAASLACWLLLVPVMTLGTTLSFAHLATPEHDFGRVRLWGTVGWVVATWGLSFWFGHCTAIHQFLDWPPPTRPDGDLADIFRLAAFLAVVLGVYTLTLPHTPPQRRAGSWLAPLEALQLLHNRSFAVYTAVTLGLCITIPFAGQVTPLLLEHLGVPLPWLSRSMTLAQATEILALALLPMFLLRLGTRGTMRLGLTAWTLALAILMVGQPLALVIGSQTLNGLCICCYIVAGQVFVNRQARGDIRASAQALLTCINGVGLLGGHLLAGGVRGLTDGAFAPTFAVATVLALILTGVFFMGFPDDEGESCPDEVTGKVKLASK